MPLPPGALDLYPQTQAAIGANPTEQRPLSWPAKPNGWVPNLSDWRPGDLLVMERVSNGAGAGAITTAIEAYQRKFAHPAARTFADCTHCAVYLGDGLIADARYGKVVTIRRLFPEVFRRKMCIVRWDYNVITKAQVRGFTRAVFDLEGVPYSNSPLAIFQWHQGSLNGSVPARNLVCSALIEYAAKQVKIALSKAPGVTYPMLPASFLAHPWLTQVPVDWRVGWP